MTMAAALLLAKRTTRILMMLLAVLSIWVGSNVPTAWASSMTDGRVARSYTYDSAQRD